MLRQGRQAGELSHLQAAWNIIWKLQSLVGGIPQKNLRLLNDKGYLYTHTTALFGT